MNSNCYFMTNKYMAIGPPSVDVEAHVEKSYIPAPRNVINVQPFLHVILGMINVVRIVQEYLV